MGKTTKPRHCPRHGGAPARRRSNRGCYRHLRRNCGKLLAALFLATLLVTLPVGFRPLLAQSLSRRPIGIPPNPPAARAQRFLRGRTTSTGTNAAVALAAARLQDAALRRTQPQLTSLTSAWTPVGPAQIASLQYGAVTGRVTAIALDPSDATGNTLYVGTTGGGVWKSTNAAGATTAVTFTPLTDSVPAFSANAGSAAAPSLSIGALSVAQVAGTNVLLAGTGDPNDASDSYYGEGILRSTDGGATWSLITQSQDGVAGNHSFVGLGIAGFAWSSTTAGLVVAAVSQSYQGSLVNAPDATNSVMGLYYSTDSGSTWQMSVLQDGSQMVQTPLPTGGNHGGNAATAVVWNAQRQRFYAAIRYHGYYESADGVTWTRLVNQPGSTLSLAACPTNPGSLGSPACPIFRGSLATQPVSGDLFALTVSSTNVSQGLWQDACNWTGSTCATNIVTFSQQLNTSSLESTGSTIPQGDYDLTLAAVPAATASSATDTLLFVGTVDLYRCSLAAGCSFRNTTNDSNGCNAPAHVAPSQHSIASLPTAGLPLLFFGNDGGLWRSTDGVNQLAPACSSDDATHFDNLNPGLGSLAEVVSFAQDPGNAQVLLVGTGANGTAASSTGAWPQLAAGEGGTVAIDPVNPQNWFVSTAPGISISYCSLGSQCGPTDFATASIGATQVQQDAALQDAPWLLDPAATSSLIAGSCRVWRGAADGTAWSSSNALSRLLTGAQNPACTLPGNGLIRSLAAAGPAASSTVSANAGSTVLYAGLAGTQDGGGTSGGHLFVTQSGQTDGPSSYWTDAAASPVSNDVADAGVFNPGGFDLSSIAPDPHDTTGLTVYATVMGFAGNGTNAPHVYRSTDGGAHWTNISSNLPNAPANSVLVDPNDANTVYIALDTGVYVTSSVTTCATANCWTGFGTSLPNAPAVQLAAGAALPTGDGRTGELRVATYGRGIWQIPLLTAAYPAQPAMQLQPASLTFAAQAVGTLSNAQSVTVTNTGNAALQVSSLSLTGDFTETDTCANSTVAIGASCSVQVAFLPTATGTRSGQLTIFGNVAGGQATVALSGTATAAAAVVLTPITLSFPATVVGSSSAAQLITIANTGGSATSLQAPVVSGDFAIAADTCSSTLPAQTSCTVSIAFAPTVSGTRTGTLTVTDGAGTQMASLTGLGQAPPTDTLAPLSLSFAPQVLQTVSALQTVTLTNSGDVPLTLIGAQTTGNFAVSNPCGTSLNGHSSCALSVTYTPQAVGAVSGTLTVSDSYRSQTVTLSGTGLAPAGVSLSPSSGLSFPATPVGISSSAQQITLTNNGGVVLNIAHLAVRGDFTLSGGSCSSQLAPASSCTAQLIFTPTAAGSRNGTLSVTDDAAGSPQTLPLTGTGVDFSLAADGSLSATIASGGSATFPLLLSPVSASPIPVSFACVGVPSSATCTIQPAGVTLATTTVVSITVQTGVTTGSVAPQWQRRGRALWLALLLPLALPTLRRRPRGLLTLLAVAAVTACLAATGCGSGRLIPGTAAAPVTAGPATPSGTYSMAVTATAAGLTRTVNLTLTVQ
ncbi:MAG: choice-of-anchor D domain-containing protein [Acidobacteriota bacterium]|nr:choice-of-anchor D domain-containing protein [Acidobacteriota bacterium]